MLTLTCDHDPAVLRAMQEEIARLSRVLSDLTALGEAFSMLNPDAEAPQDPELLRAGLQTTVHLALDPAALFAAMTCLHAALPPGGPEDARLSAAAQTLDALFPPPRTLH